jgi:hypothetical protein
MSRFEKFPERTETAKPKSRTWDVTDACIVIGLALVVAGIAFVSRPAALIVGGMVLVGLAAIWPQR